jgi:hypothetical protein
MIKMKIINFGLACLLLIGVNSCWFKRITCAESLEGQKTLVIPTMKIQKIFTNGNTLQLHGISPATQKKVYFSDTNGWYFDIGKKFQVGDTLIKKKGEPIIRIYRKNERWSFTYTCDKDEQGNDIVRSEDVRF